MTKDVKSSKVTKTDKAKKDKKSADKKEDKFVLYSPKSADIKPVSKKVSNKDVVMKEEK